MKKLNYNSDSVEWNKIRKKLEEIQWKEIFKDENMYLNILVEIMKL